MRDLSRDIHSLTEFKKDTREFPRRWIQRDCLDSVETISPSGKSSATRTIPERLGLA